MDMEEIAKYAFMVFVVIAIIAGLAIGYLQSVPEDVAQLDGYVMLIMLILGVIVGLVSVTAKEVSPFLLAAIALVVVGVSANVWSPLGQVSDLLFYWASAILRYIVGFAAPAAVIIAIKSFWSIAKEK